MSIEHERFDAIMEELRAIHAELVALRERAAADAVDLVEAIENATDRLGGHQRT